LHSNTARIRIDYMLDKVAYSVIVSDLDDIRLAAGHVRMEREVTPNSLSAISASHRQRLHLSIL